MIRFILILSLVSLACVAPALTLPTVPPPTPTAQRAPTMAVVILPTKTPTALAMVTAAQALNVRVMPGNDKRVIGALYNGDTVSPTGRCSKDPAGWAQIIWKGIRAWVNAKYLSDNLCKK